MTTKRTHIWITNKAFTRLTGYRKVCLECRQVPETAARECPGRPPAAQA